MGLQLVEQDKVVDRGNNDMPYLTGFFFNQRRDVALN